MSFTEHSFQSVNSHGLHRIVYNDWGPKNGVPIICVAGLTGNGHDFDYLAQSLVKKNRRLVCVDLPGRGRSDFLQEPLDYNYKQYAHDLMGLLAHLGIEGPQSVDWIGISLGGLLGILLGGMENSPVRRLIINDVGPEVPEDALDFIFTVISQEYRFDTIAELEARMRATRGLTWGPVTDEQWRHMAEHSARALEDGSISYAYDPGIAKVFGTHPIGDENLWPYWDRIACPVLLIQGGKSVILPDGVVDHMRMRGPGADMQVNVFEDCGHVPSLMHPDHIKTIETWLDKTQI